MLLLDASGLVAALLPNQPEHDAAASVLARETERRILSPFVLAEVDYLVQKYEGAAAAAALLDEVARGVYELAPFDAGDVAEAGETVRRYADLAIGLADASIVVLAGRHSAKRVLTLDERHFRALRTPAGDAFAVLPADG